MPGPDDSSAYRTQSRDTAEWAERVLFEHWRVMDPTAKAKLVSDLCRSLHRLSLAGLRLQYPDAGEAELELRAAYRRLGAELFERAFGPPPPG